MALGFSRRRHLTLRPDAPGAVAIERQRVGERRRFDARHLLHPAHDLLVERVRGDRTIHVDCRGGSTRSTATRSGWKPRLTSSTRAKLRISRPAVTSRTNAERDFRDDQRAPHPGRARAAAGAARLLFQRIDRAGGGHLQRGDESEDHAGQDGDADGERERGAVDFHGLQQRQAEALEVRHGAGREDREQQAERGAAEREHEAFGQQLADQARARRAERGPHRDLRLTRGGAGEQQVREIRARDQQDRADRREQQEQRRAEASADVRLQRREPRPPARAAVLPFAVQGARQRVHFGLRRLDAHAGLQPADEREGVAPLIVRLVDRERRPDVGARAWREDRAEVERGGHHADHGHRFVVDGDRASDQRAIGVEAALPQAVRDQRRLRAFVEAFLLEEQAADRRPHAERLVEAAGDHHVDQALGFGADGELRAQVAVEREVAAERLERLAALAPGLEVERPGRAPGQPAVVAGLAAPRCRPDRRPPRPPRRGSGGTPPLFSMKTSRSALREGQRPEQQRVHQAEDRGVGADADGEDQDGDEREAGVAAQRAEGVAQVVQERVHVRNSPGVAVEEARGLDAAQCQHGLAPRLFGAQTAPAMVFGGHLQMARQLLFEIAIEAVAADERGDFRRRGADAADQARQAGAGAAGAREPRESRTVSSSLPAARRGCGPSPRTAVPTSRSARRGDACPGG